MLGYGYNGVAGGAAGSAGYGVFGYASGPNAIGAIGTTFSATSTAYGLYGNAVAPAYAGWFSGNVHISGTLSKTAGSFRIDHPLDPAHKLLQHSFVESPDMMNVYNGNVVTDGTGLATVKLPEYFEALNQDFRYQLTIVGTRGWNARVVKEIAHNRFTIQSDEPRVQVSWQVTGIRHDPYANAHRIQVVVPKTGADAGKYVSPELYGKGKSAGIGYRPLPNLQVQR
jgi:hypothetical protein